MCGRVFLCSFFNVRYLKKARLLAWTVLLRNFIVLDPLFPPHIPQPISALEERRPRIQKGTGTRKTQRDNESAEQEGNNVERSLKVTSFPLRNSARYSVRVTLAFALPSAAMELEN